MIKVGEKGRTKYRFERNDLTAPHLSNFLREGSRSGTAASSNATTPWLMSSLRTPRSAFSS
jgi:hypothetical protein